MQIITNEILRVNWLNTVSIKLLIADCRGSGIGTYLMGMFYMNTKPKFLKIMRVEVVNHLTESYNQ